MLGQSFSTPTFVCAQSIGPFKLTRIFVKRVLNRATKVTVREGITFSYLDSIGVSTEILSQTADMAFLLEPITKKASKDIIANEGIKIEKSLTLGVTVSALVEKRYNSRGNDFASDLAKTLDKVIEKHDVSVLFVSHVTGPSDTKNDRLLASKIANLLKNKESVHAMTGDYSPTELKGIISTCDIFMGSRMHSNIGALSTLVPTLAIIYSHKTDGIMKSLKQSKNILAIDNLNMDTVYEKISLLINDRDNISSSLAVMIPGVKDKSQKNLTAIKGMVK
jgi:colanic acid/amylovoran biosynthesis protein